MKKTITTAQKPNCPICNNLGTCIYENLTDSLSSTEGIWSMKTCNNVTCGTYWLDPAPDLNSIPLLYEGYTTHIYPEQPLQLKRTGLKKFLDNMRYSVLNRELGYPSSLSKSSTFFLNTLSKIHPGWRDEQRNQVLYVPFVENGHLLDIGCGNGSAMTVLKRRGWKVSGTDFDNTALDNARKKGLDVYLGDLKTINFPDNTFDSILLSHVIEHVPDPIETLRECHRILKPEGRLIAITPNADSRGHKRFKHHWRGLEVPRHLQLFTPSSLENTGLKAGFRKSKGTTCLQGIYYIWDASVAHENTGTYDLPPATQISKFISKIKLFISGIKFAIKPGKEETAILYCQK